MRTSQKVLLIWAITIVSVFAALDARADICNHFGDDYVLKCECVKTVVPPVPDPVPVPISTIDKEWLEGHNNRRMKYGVPTLLEWHPTLAASAKTKALQLARTCSLQHGNPKNYGENLAAGKLTPNDVLTMWVENEAGTQGGHFTQVLWKMTKYVGCSQTNCNNSGSGGSTKYGMVHVCHYVRPGNCNGYDYMTNDSPCPPFKP